MQRDKRAVAARSARLLLERFRAEMKNCFFWWWRDLGNREERFLRNQITSRHCIAWQSWRLSEARTICHMLYDALGYRVFNHMRYRVYHMVYHNHTRSFAIVCGIYYMHVVCFMICMNCPKRKRVYTMSRSTYDVCFMLKYVQYTKWCMLKDKHCTLSTIAYSICAWRWHPLKAVVYAVL